MATFFGEVLSVYSRAVEEDEEELEENEEDEEILSQVEEKREVRVRWGPELEPAPSSGHKLRCSDLLLAVGHNATRFLSVYFLSVPRWEVVGHVSLWNERTVRSDASMCVLHRHKDSSVLMCQVNCYVAEDQLFQWTEKVLGCLDSSQLRVTVLSDCSAAEYRTAEPSSPTPFLRSLHTSSFTDQPVCPPVDLPNLITGLPAAVLSHCQVQHISAVVYQCYTDARCPDSSTIDTYKPAVARIAQSLKLDLSPNVDILRKIITDVGVESNLYI